MSIQRITVILVTHNHEEPVVGVLHDLAVAAFALRLRGVALKVLVADANSTDGTLTAVSEWAERLELDVTATACRTAALGEAYLQAFAAVAADPDADAVLTMDATGQHDASQIPHLVEQLLNDQLDVVIGSRWAYTSGTPGIPLSRYLVSRLANLAFRMFTGVRGVTDATTAFRLATTRVLRAYDPRGLPVDSYSVQTSFVALADAAGYRIGESPIIFRSGPGATARVRVRDTPAFWRSLAVLGRRVRETRVARLSPNGRVFSTGHFGAADDLEQLATAHHFFGWVLDEFSPHIRGRILEVGAGTGAVTRRLVERYPGQVEITALEPAENLFPDLQAYAALTPGVEARRDTLADLAPDDHRGFDAVVYLNVLEHIEDDARELRLAYRALRPGGALLVFGPALEWLYSELDFRAGHYRRYSVEGLRELAKAAGLDVVKAQYFDAFGVAPYLLVYRILRKTRISGSSMMLYDRVIVPLSRRLAADPAFGKNVVLVAVKP